MMSSGAGEGISREQMPGGNASRNTTPLSQAQNKYLLAKPET